MTFLFAAIAATPVTTRDLRLVEAIKHEDRAAIRTLLTQKADVNVPEADGATALHWATHWNDLELADLLIRRGANVDAANDYGVTALSLACVNRNDAIIQKLLRAGADSNAAQSNGETPLMTCVRTGSADGVKALVAHGAIVDAKERSRGQTALMWAAAHRRPELTRTLIEHGADIRARSRVTRLLVNRARNLARDVDEVDIGGFTPLLFASRSGDLDSARLLLAAGASVNDTAPDGNSALVIASHSGHGRLAAFLLDNGADPNAAGGGYAALHAAVLKSDLDLVKALLAGGADANARVAKGTPVLRFGQNFALAGNLVGATPLLLAAKYAEVEMMQLLVSAGADPQVPTTDGTTPLMVAAGLGWLSGANRRDRYLPLDTVNAELQNEARTLEAVRLAIELRGDVNAVNNDGDTALHAAASKGFKRVAELLIARGARLDLKNKRGQTPAEMLRRLVDRQ